MLLNDDQIAREVAERGMIDPFEPTLVTASSHADIFGVPQTEKVISYGLSSFGYDIRPIADWRVFTNVFGEVVDPKYPRSGAFVSHHGDSCIIPPNSFVLTASVEYFRIPDDILGVCVGKSTYARCGVVCNVTPLEPGWEGNLTIELSNTTPLPVRVYAFEGIGQILFFRGNPPKANYRTRAGKYQGTVGIVTAKL